MAQKKPSYSVDNLQKLKELCDRHGYEIEKKSPDQYRVYGATHVIDFWVARMVYHRIAGEQVRSNEAYHRGLDWQFNEKQVSYLLATGDYKGRY